MSNAATGTHTAFGTYTGAGSTALVHAVSFTGGGVFNVNTPLGAIVFGQVGTATQLTGYPASSTAGSNTTVNMSGLASFTANVASFRVGDYSGSGNNGFATVTLAPTSTITATTFSMLSGRAITGSSGTVTLNLGTGTNTINANTLYVGGDDRVVGGSGVSNTRSQALLQFGAGNTTGTLTIRNKAGNPNAANLIFGVSHSGSGTTPRNNVINLTGHNVDVSLNTFQVGGIASGETTPNTGPVNATFTFNQGTISANTVAVGNRIGTHTFAQNNTGSTAGTINIAGGAFTVNGTPAHRTAHWRQYLQQPWCGYGSQVTTGTVNVTGGTLNVPNGGITLATNTGTYTGAGATATFTTTGILNIAGTGSVSVGGDILAGSGDQPGDGQRGAGPQRGGAALNLNGFNIGGATPVTFDLQQGTLSNVSQVNSGAAFSKTGTGTLTLLGTNAYRASSPSRPERWRRVPRTRFPRTRFTRSRAARRST